jgi:hypothetical protein
MMVPASCFVHPELTGGPGRGVIGGKPVLKIGRCAMTDQVAASRTKAAWTIGGMVLVVVAVIVLALIFR